MAARISMLATSLISIRILRAPVGVHNVFLVEILTFVEHFLAGIPKNGVKITKI